MITEDEASNIKLLEKSQGDQRTQVVLSQLDVYIKTLLGVLRRLATSDKVEVVRNVEAIVNDLLLTSKEFLQGVAHSPDVFSALLGPVQNQLDQVVRVLGLYNVTIVADKQVCDGVSTPNDVVSSLFQYITKLLADGDANSQYIAIQLEQALVSAKPFKDIYIDLLAANFKPLDALIAKLTKLLVGLQLLYHVLITTWIVLFSARANKQLVVNYPDIIGLLLQIAKDLIKLKIVRVSIAILRNLVEISESNADQFKVIKLLLFNGAVLTFKVLRERKFAANGLDEELAGDLQYLADKLDEIVTTKLTSFDEYLTELENPKLLSWASPTHKSEDFWMLNANKFKDDNYKLVDKMFAVLQDDNIATTPKVIILNDLEHLISRLGSDLVTYINTCHGGKYKLLVMNLLENNGGDNELKYQALKTIQLLVGQNL